MNSIDFIIVTHFILKLMVCCSVSTHGGVHIHADGLTVTSPVLMWVKVTHVGTGTHMKGSPDLSPLNGHMVRLVLFFCIVIGQCNFESVIRLWTFCWTG